MSSVRFRKLAVRRMPGIGDGYELVELAAGVNIVFGPNGSGKTTTSRAIQAVVWPPSFAPDTACVDAIFELDGDLWSIELDAGRAKIQKAGHPSASPNVLPGEARDRYLLPLHDLLTIEDRGLARVIALESVGGYDLEAAAAILGPRSTPSRPKREQEELRAARDRLQTARAVQERLQTEASSLRADESRVEGGAALEERLALLRAVAEHARRSEELADAADGLSAFPAVVGRMVGDEDRRLRDLRTRLHEAEEAMRSAAQRTRIAREELKRSRLRAETAETGEIEALSRELTEAEAIDSEIRAADRAYDEAQVSVEAEARRLGGFADLDLVDTFGAEELGRLRPLLEELHQTRSDRAKVETEIGLLDGAGAPRDRQKLEHAVWVLQRWLQSPGSEDPASRRVRLLAIAAASLLVAGGILLTVVSPASLVLSAVGLTLLYLVLSTHRPADDRRHLEGEFAELGLPEPPAAWEADPVREYLRGLHEKIAAGHAAEQAATRRDRLERELKDLEDRESDRAREVEALSSAFGLERPGDVGLIYLLDRICKLHDARARLDRADAARVKSWAHRSELLARANERLTRLGESPVADLVSLRTIVHDLEDRLRVYRKAEADLRGADKDRQTAEERSTECRNEIGAVFDRLEIEDADEATLAAWCAERQPMLLARTEHDAVARERVRLEATLRRLPGFDEALLSPDRPAVEEEIRRIEDELAALKPLRDRIAEIRAEIARATRGHEIEDAIAEVERCVDNLREVRDRDASAWLADVLVKHVEQESRNEHRPEVFHRASRIFAQVTRGRYELRLEDAGEPAFRAFDVHGVRSQPLEELSSATRVQLLLAVRIAFVEVQEGGLRLPLLLDETLANSDTERAAAIMEAVITLAAKGRQVFYFTAQPDEVRKWWAALAAHPAVESKVLDLGQIRRLRATLDLSALEAATEPPAAVPPPNGSSHAEYGALLKVPAVQVFAPAEALHLWYIIDSPERLHRAIATLGAETLGGFRNLVENGAAGLLPNDLARSVELLGSAADAALRKMRTGRSRSLDRHALLTSGAISDKFIDEVCELCQSVRGDASRLLEHLENGGVPKFLKRKTEALREFCLAEGYLDPRPVPRPEEVRVEVIREMAPAIERGEVRLDEIERLLRRLGVGAAGGSTAPHAAEIELWNAAERDALPDP